MSQENQTQRSLGKKLALAALGMGFALFLIFLLEMLLALLNLGQPSVEKDPFFDFEACTGLFETYQGEDGAAWLRTREPKLQFFNMQTFKAQKDPNVFRVFALGGSTTFGRPYDWRIAFPRWTQDLLNAAGPEKRVEVINCGGVSYASYRVAVLMEELNAYQPDLFIVYTGHNEFLEERTYGQLLRQSDALKFVRRLRTARLMSSLLKGPEGEGTRQAMSAEVKAKLDVWNGLAGFTRENAQREAVVAHFRHNLNRIADLAQQAGAPLLLVEPVSNIKDFSPFKSQPPTHFTPQQRETVNQQLQTAADHLDQNQAAQSITLLKQILEKDPDHAEVHYRLGRAHQALKDMDTAQHHYQMARDLDVCPLRSLSAMTRVLEEVAEQRNLPLIPLTRILAEKGQTTLGHSIPGDEFFLDHVHPNIQIHQLIAEKVVDAVLENQWLEVKERPGNPQTLYQTAVNQLDESYYARRDLNLARVLGWAGKYEEATRALLRSREALDGDPDMHFNLGVLYERQRQHQDAVREYAAALAVEPDYFEANYNMGKALQALNRHKEASEALARALALRPDESEVVYNLALSQLKSGQLEAAAQQISALQARDPQFPGADMLKGRVLLRQKQTEQAATLFREQAAANPTAVEAPYYLGLTLVEAGDMDGAMEAFQQTLALQDDFSEAWRNIARIHEAANREEQALEAWRTAAEHAPLDPLIPFDLGLFHHKNGRLDKALSYYRQAVKLDPTFARAYENLGAVLGVQQAYGQAMEAFQKAVELNPQSRDGHYNLAQLLLMSGNPQQAAHHLKKAQALGTQPSPQILEALKGYL